ncbi:MAG: DNA topoisomerase I, partial [Elusimicrobia bacterium CG1_02_37_114]
MNLVIVESPTKERTISKFLGKEFVIKSSYGHVCDLPKKELGIDIAKNFQPKYVMLPRAKKIISSIVKLTKKAKKIYLATDFDREGEAIAWHIVKSAKLDKKKTKRITFHEITPEAIHESLKNTHEIDLSLVNAQQARRILDRIVGYKLSPLLWRKIARGLSAGRVQSIVLRFIVEREKEIKEFKPQEYWTITAKLAGDGVEFDAALVSKDDTKFEYKQAYQLFADEYNVTLSLLKNKEETDKVIDELKRLSYRVEKIIRKKQNKTPPPPFTTSTLQQDAVYKLGYYSNKTMHVAQMLYEGIELPDGAVGLITYMRTDSVSVANSAREEARKYIIENFGDKYLPLKPPTYKTVSKGAQEAHECIRPTSVYRDPEKIKKYLTAEQHALYKLIWQRFLASQMKNAIYDVLTIEIAGEP